MPMKLSIGLTRKVGQPHYGSLGASCAVELDVDADAADLEGEPAGFRRRVRALYAACDRAVREELARQQAGPPGESSEGLDHRDDAPAPPRRPATAAQVRALGKLAARRGVDLDALAAGRFGMDGPEDLSVAEASRLIDELQHASADATA